MCYSLGGSRGPPVVLALLCFALCLTFFFLGQEFLRRPGEGTRTGVLSVCLGALGRPCWLSPRSDCGLVAPCPQASHPAGPDPRRSGFPSCVTRFFGSWRRVAAVFVLLFVKILLDIHLRRKWTKKGKNAESAMFFISTVLSRRPKVTPLRLISINFVRFLSSPSLFLQNY